MPAKTLLMKICPALVMSVAFYSSCYAQEKIVAASDVGYQPFSSSSPSGGFEGIDIDIANALAKQTGVKIEIIDQPWATTFAGLNAKKFDMVLSPAMITEDRAKQVLFAQAYGDATYQFVLRKGGVQVSSPDDLKGKVIAVNKGNLFDKWLSSRQGEYGWSINRYDKNSDAIQSVASGQSDAALVYSAVAGYVAQHTPVLTTSSYVINQGEVYGYSFRKDDVATRNKIDFALQCLKKNGTLAAIYKKWTGLEVLPDGAAKTVTKGVGQPGFAGYDASVPAPACQ